MQAFWSLWIADQVVLHLVQNALKVFPDFPPELMDVVRKTDPATVTQHGLYMRDLSGLSADAEQPDAEACGPMNAKSHNSELSGSIHVCSCRQDVQKSKCFVETSKVTLDVCSC